VTAHFDVVVVGSGFGGSVAALRLTEKGYRVLVVEAGRRWADADFPRTNWRIGKYLFAPRLGLRGIQRIHALDNLLVLAGAGVGGGSLVYANTLYEPGEEFFGDPQWADITDWQAELGPHYDQARRMLGVADNPGMTPADEVMRAVAGRMDVADTFRLTPVGVFFGDGPECSSPDPFFGGVGPGRTGCTECGECMTGCRHNAKNTLVKNYLALAEEGGARVVADTEVVAVRELADGYAVDCAATGIRRRPRGTVTCDQVVVAAGTFGTQLLLHRMKAGGHLPNLSDALGRLSRSNSESLGGAFADGEARYRADLSRGVAITSSFHPEPQTHVEPVRFGHGSNLMHLLGTRPVPPVAGRARWRDWLAQSMRDPRGTLRFLDVRRASERSIIALVMQSLDNSVTVSLRRSRFGGSRLTSVQGHDAPNPTWIPAGAEAMRLMAEELDGAPAGNLGDLVDRPFTAHFIGGAVIAADADRGVVDGYHRAFGHPGLHVMDGAAVPANLGVNPSLTITALAERACALWPNRGETDPRPALGESYRTLDPVSPKHPVVPADAVGALRW
jgi:cholesterol oxidase